MDEIDLKKFPDQSVDDAGMIVNLPLWIDEFEQYFDATIVGEIQKTIRIGLKTAPFILISCAIDFLVTFWAGAESTGPRYADFVNTFFPGYDGKSLYAELRCRMVHNHSVGKRVIICWNEPDIHRCTTTDGVVVLTLEQFFDDFVKAKDRYFTELRKDPKLLEKQIARFNRLGVLCSVDPNELRE